MKMKSKPKRWDQILWTGRDRETFIRKSVLSPLWLLCLLYGLVMRLRAWAYAAGILKTGTVDARVIVCGNLTVGGSGKTALAAWLAKKLLEAGKRPAVILRGYNGRAQKGPLLVRAGDGPVVSAEDAGDEAVMLAQKLAGVPVIVGKDRYLDAAFAIEKFKATHLILDDGFQHLALARDLNLLVVEADRDLEREYLLPRGPLREPLGAAGRADALVISRSRGKEDELQPWMQRLCPGLPVFRMRYRVLAIAEPDMPSLAFCGLGRPEGFFQGLSEAGIKVVDREVFPDHYHYQAADLADLAGRARKAGAQRLLTTEKDAVKISTEWRQGFPLEVVKVEPEFFGGEEELVRLAMG